MAASGEGVSGAVVSDSWLQGAVKSAADVIFYIKKLIFFAQKILNYWVN
jgi:hypothetical protein